MIFENLVKYIYLNYIECNIEMHCFFIDLKSNLVESDFFRGLIPGQELITKSQVWGFRVLEVFTDLKGPTHKSWARIFRRLFSKRCTLVG